MINSLTAAILEAPCKPLVIKEIKIPPLLHGQVLVKVFYSGVCRSQLMEIRGNRGVDPWLPHMLGHEGSGVVVGVGDGVSKVCIGDEVILGWLKGEGHDAPGAKFECEGKIINSGRVTTFSNYTIVSENRVVKKPLDLALDAAVLFGCALPTGAGMVLNELLPTQGECGAVLGLGGIGLSALMALSVSQCQNIVAIDPSDDKLHYARQLGATHIINPSQCNVEKEIKHIFPDGLDFCIESAGSVSTIELGFALIRKHGGRLLFASHPPDGEVIRLAPHDLISGKRIQGSWGGAIKPDRDVPRLYSIINENNISLSPLLTKRYSLYEINNALDDLDAGLVFRPLIEMNHA